MANQRRRKEELRLTQHVYTIKQALLINSKDKEDQIMQDGVGKLQQNPNHKHGGGSGSDISKTVL
jgi:hypothetical protein